MYIDEIGANGANFRIGYQVEKKPSKQPCNDSRCNNRSCQSSVSLRFWKVMNGMVEEACPHPVPIMFLHESFKRRVVMVRKLYGVL